MHPAKAWLIASQRSGAGKTTVTIGLLAALRRRGVAVRAAKSGPDYIDPAFHEAASGHAGINLDSWAMPPALLDALAQRQAPPGTLLLVESAMGLFDGVAGEPGRTGSSADLATRLGLPVLLVLDVSGQAQTAAAVAHGLGTFRPGVRIGGVILNRVGSARHRATVEQALAECRIPVIGALARDPSIVLPERHLGLVQAGEHPDLAARLDHLANTVEAGIDLDALLQGAAPLHQQGAAAPAALKPPGQRIALARDEAFSFIYPHLLHGWRGLGAEITLFSPMADEPPPDDADCCWLPGGYPELHAARLAGAARFMAGLRRFAATRPVHGECGGYMLLGRSLQDATGAVHPMAGLLSHVTSFGQPGARRRMTLGYRSATLLAPGALGPAGATLRGHEFHYAICTDPGTDEPLCTLSDGRDEPLGPAGGRRGHVTGAFFHAIATHSPAPD